jgi:outer membrane protein assembly factor BamB
LISGTLWADEFSDNRLANWHQFRGPEATGVAPKGNPPIEWSETKNIKWKVAIPGRGSASPIIWGDRIFILTAVKTDRTAPAAEATTSTGSISTRTIAYSPSDLLAQREENREQGQGRGRREGRGRGGPGGFGGRGRGGFGIERPTNYHQFVVMCLDRNTGETIWQQVAADVVPHEGHHNTSSFASASPITNGTHVWVSFGSRGIFCYDLAGDQKWAKDLGDMRTRNSFGEGASPTIEGDTLVVPWDHEEDSFIVALDAPTGDEKWRQPREEVTTWATPLVVEWSGRKQVITPGTNRIRSYDLATGDVLWECGGLGSNPIATPLAIGGLAICMTGHQDPAGIAVPLDAKGDVTGTEKVAWQIENTPYVSSPILYDQQIYFTKGRDAILSSIDARTGEFIISPQRLPEMSSVYSSPVGAAGRIYLASREGTIVVLKHGRELDVLATNTLDDGAIDASPAIVGNELFIRGEGHLYCIAEQ